MIDCWATSITYCTMEALGECLQSWDVVFLFVLKVKAYQKNYVTTNREDLIC